MALIKYLMGTLSGKIAGNVYSRNNAGAYVRGWVRPVQPQSERQTQQTERISGLARSWGGDLTEDQRAAWATLAQLYTYPNRLGDPIKLNPNTLFVKVNAIRIVCGDTPLLDPPTDLSVAALESVVVSQCFIGDRELTFTISAALGASEKLYCRAALNVPESRNFVKNLYRLVEVSAAAAVNPVVINIPADLPVPAADMRCFFRLHRYNGETGALSPGYNVSAVAVAGP